MDHFPRVAKFRHSTSRQGQGGDSHAARNQVAVDVGQALVDVDVGGKEGGAHLAGAVGLWRALARHLELAAPLVEAVRRAEVGEAIRPDWKLGHPASVIGSGTAGDCDGADDKKVEDLHFGKRCFGQV